MELKLVTLSKSSLGRTSGGKIALSLSCMDLVTCNDIASGHVLAFNGVDHEAITMIHVVVSLRIDIVYFRLVNLGH